jgi:hypothetical protein
MRPVLRRVLRVALFALPVACGSSGLSGFGSDSGASIPDATVPPRVDSATHEASSLLPTRDTGSAPSCTNLQCAATDCAAMGKPATSLTGTIRDPGGNLPLYNVYVYVPNVAPAPILPGNPTCTACEAPASGDPILGVSTGTDGKFNLQKGAGDTWDVPTGSNIPLVIQVGKWRRQVVVPQIDACTTVDLDTVLGPDKLRLPKMSSEGDMPLIALTTGGYDAFECFLLKVIGVDQSEFVAPGSATGHVHVYTGAYEDPDSPAASITGGNTVEETFLWWNSSANLLKYDFVLNACDGVESGSRGTGYTAMEEYLNGGGRAFVTDFFVDWFSPPDAPPDDSTVASWPGWGNALEDGPYFVDTSFPKGQAFGQWLLQNNVAQAMGTGISIPLTDTYPSVNAAGPPMYPGSTQWIYNAPSAWSSLGSTSYLSFNTPIGKPTTDQCGRAVFSGVHVYLPDTVAEGGGGTFPTECGTEGGMAAEYAVNQKALEFLFFDLSSCVQDDTAPPTMPPPSK